MERFPLGHCWLHGGSWRKEGGSRRLHGLPILDLFLEILLFLGMKEQAIQALS
jgi:hypothetical protein